MTSSSELVINDKLDFRYEAEVYSASVSAPMVPAYAQVDAGPVAESVRQGVPGRGLTRRAILHGQACAHYGSFDGLEPKHITLYLAPRGLWSQRSSDALRL